MYAAVRVRGYIGTEKSVRDTLSMLRLERVNHCVLIPNTPVMKGMVTKVKDYVTWGEIDKTTLEKLVEKRGRLPGDKKLDPTKAKSVVKLIEKEESVKNVEIKPVFRLSPPSKGYKTVRMPYPKGDLGYRGDKINPLLKRMI